MSLLSFQLYINYLSAFIAFVTSFAASSDPRISLSLVAGHIYPSSRASRPIMRIIKLQLHKEGYTWDVVRQEARDFYWEEFQENYTTARERLVSSQTDESEAESRIDEVALYLEAVGGREAEEELRAHVMRLSGEPGAGTSSSDPAPATDKNVSTSQQQPLPSPDPNVADNTLATPPGTTAHPVGTPPYDSILDRADEQPRRFDFGPL
ncbi:hypothetical protein JCGZ_13674 [Jatropha curcas]|uniref:Uncharacterized protein n=1 Tax=Jatropha curcas TaxID=180498 RepID=A0A067K8W2_JATCU|nr:hypothetical protein JCGZ_13674 [Jatropha curcas]